MTAYVTEMERALEDAETRIAELEAELRLWKSGAKSFTAERVKQQLEANES